MRRAAIQVRPFSDRREINTYIELQERLKSITNGLYMLFVKGTMPLSSSASSGFYYSLCFISSLDLFESTSTNFFFSS